MAERPRIAVDVMGGDGGPAAILPAVSRMAARAELLLVGDAAAVDRHGDAAAHALEVVSCSERIEATDSLSNLLRRKNDTPVHAALRLLAEGRADALVSASDTGALMALARQALDMVPGISRPAILKRLEGVRAPFYLLDLGANIDCDAALLAEFARMGTTVARRIGGVAAPRAALLNIGTEAGKGPRPLNDCAALLERDQAVSYAGFLEANRLFDSDVDVVVCDGFAGNIALKAIEGAAAMAAHLLKEGIEGLTEEGRRALTQSGLLPGLKQALNPEQYNGASLVGLQGVVVKSHGGARAVGFERALEEAIDAVRVDLPGELGRAFSS